MSFAFCNEEMLSLASECVCGNGQLLGVIGL